MYQPPQAGYASSIPPPSPSASTAAYSPTGGKISAGAFRKAQPRRSDLGHGSAGGAGQEEGAGPNAYGTPGASAGQGPAEGSRRLPVPPGGAAAPAQPLGQGWADEKKALSEQMQSQQREQEQRGAFEDAPPGYSRGEDSLR